MAYISRGQGGCFTLQFRLFGDRKSIWLGKMSQRDRTAWQVHVRELIAAKEQNRTPYAETSAWADRLAPRLRRKLVGKEKPREQWADPSKPEFTLQLVDPLEPSKSTVAALGPFLDTYTRQRTDVKESTRVIWANTIRNLKEYFQDRDMSSISEGDADLFKLNLIEQGLAPTTVSKRLQFARMFFKAAIATRC